MNTELAESILKQVRAQAPISAAMQRARAHDVLFHELDMAGVFQPLYIDGRADKEAGATMVELQSQEATRLLARGHRVAGH